MKRNGKNGAKDNAKSVRRLVIKSDRSKVSDGWTGENPLALTDVQPVVVPEVQPVVVPTVAG